VADDEDYLIDDLDDSFLSMEITTKSSLTEEDLMQLKVEVEALTNEKALMKESLLELSDQIENKRAELEKLDEDYEHRRDQFAQEVSMLQSQLDSQAVDRREDASSGHQSGLRSLVRGFGGDGKVSTHTTDEDKMLEMRTLPHGQSKNNTKGLVPESEGMQLARELGRSLGEERTRCEELQSQCTKLEKTIESFRGVNTTLHQRNKALTEELAALKSELGAESSNLEVGTEHPRDYSSAPTQEESSNTFTRDGKEMIKSRAEEVLRDLGAINSGGGPCNNSVISSICTDIEDDGDLFHDAIEAPLVHISNINEANRCFCESSMFGDNAEHVEFYLPQLGVACACGRNNVPTFAGVQELCSLENILRPWQVQFLASVGLVDAVEFVHAFKQRGSILAKDLRRWRKMMHLPTVRTKSCRVALHIWNRTVRNEVESQVVSGATGALPCSSHHKLPLSSQCKSVIKYARQQRALGVERPAKPDFLNVQFANDHSTVSTLGVGSIVNEMEEAMGAE